jgi:NADH-quinone oxidoreductase subunit L
MLDLVWLIPTFPFAGFIALALVGARLSRTAVAWVGVGSIGLSAIMAALAGLRFLLFPPPGHIYSQILWRWVEVGNFGAEIGLSLDALALVMVLVVSWVGFFIHLYSAEFMAGEEGYSRFFACMNLFIGFMLTLVLADNLLLLYLGWEGVGLCSYLLIGFWYKDPANGRAAMKAFIVTRIGDTAMAIGLFLIFTHLGTLNIQALMHRASQQWAVGATLPVAAAALLLGGAVGKSAQLPLQTWLPDAMAGPTPVSALIHAATMVTAGVYLIARTHVLFSLAPTVQLIVALIGAVTLLLAGFSALAQRDIKRVLAYSTISQVGYMFLALGVGAWSAAIFHFMTHAFFKALLFLGAGVVILSLDREHDMFKMGGLRRQLPLAFWTFLIGSASLSALPLVTAGFYSKDLILWQAWSSDLGSPWLWGAGLAGALLTSVYTFRMVILTFFGEARAKVSERSGIRIAFPLVALAVLSLTGGFVELPETLGNVPLFSQFLHSVLPEASGTSGGRSLLPCQLVAAIASLGGIWLAYLLFLRHRRYTEDLARTLLGKAVHCFCLGGWSFDWLYDTLFVQPFVMVARLNKDDVLDHLYQGVARLCRILHSGLSMTQTGKARWYAAAMGIGAIVIIGIAVLL